MRTDITTDPGTTPNALAVSPVRAAADTIQRWLAVTGVVLCALQVALAALGFWGVTEHPGDEAADKAAFAPHAVNGEILGWVAVAMLICGIITRVNKLVWVGPLVAAVLLWAVQGPLVGLGFEVSRYFGALHALSGMLITALFCWVAYDRWPHRAGRRG
ncbi:MAG: hypothetical protein ACRDO8_06520 [Nocardioidaceae bacterium]